MFSRAFWVREIAVGWLATNTLHTYMHLRYLCIPFVECLDIDIDLSMCSGHDSIILTSRYQS